MEIAIATVIGAIIAGILGPILLRMYRDYKKNTLKYGQQVGIRVCDGNYVMNDMTAGNILFGREKHIQSWELFEIAYFEDPFANQNQRSVCYGDKVVFRAINNKMFVGSDLNNVAELVARVPWVKSWEVFILVHPYSHRHSFLATKCIHYGSYIALKAHNGKYVMYNRDGDHSLAAVVPHVDEWETFILMDPNNPK